MTHYQLGLDDNEKVYFLNEPKVVPPELTPQTPPPSINTDSVPPTPPIAPRWWNRRWVQWAYPALLLLCYKGYEKGCGLESHINKMDKDGIYFNKSVCVMRDTVRVGFLGDRAGTRPGGFAVFNNEHNRKNLFVGTYYRQYPALVFYNGDTAVPRKDSELFFIGKTDKESFFSGIFWRKPAIVGSLMSRNRVGNDYHPTNTAYDKKTIGIVSESVGEIKNNHARDEYIIAQEGTIQLRVNGQGGTIEIGDLLTSSSTEGVAMKADLQNIKSRGSIIAKALAIHENQKESKILVLITRQ